MVPMRRLDRKTQQKVALPLCAYVGCTRTRHPAVRFFCVNRVVTATRKLRLFLADRRAVEERGRDAHNFTPCPTRHNRTRSCQSTPRSSAIWRSRRPSSVAATLTGSSAMLSEGFIRSSTRRTSSCCCDGLKRAARPADLNHPFGHGRELYFWSFIVALLVLVAGAALWRFTEGVNHVLHPSRCEPLTNYIVLGASFAFESASWWVGLKAFPRQQGQSRDTLMGFGQQGSEHVHCSL